MDQWKEQEEDPPRVISLPLRRRWGWRRWGVPLCVLTLVAIGLEVRFSLEDWRGITPLLRETRPVPQRMAVRSVAPVQRLDPVPDPPLIRPEATALRPAGDEVFSFPWNRPEPGLVSLPVHDDLAADLASREIVEEALRQQAEQVRIAILQDHQTEIERHRTRALRFQRILDAVAEAEAERSAFHAEVVALLDTYGPRAGPKLIELMTKHDAEALPEVVDAVRVVMERRSAPTVSAKKIRLYRSLGVPEPVILSDLLRAEWNRIPARNGPKNALEAMVRAARKLQAVPPEPRQAVAAPPGQTNPGMRQ